MGVGSMCTRMARLTDSRHWKRHFFLSRCLLLPIFCALGPGPAGAVERVGDAPALHALQDRGRVADVLASDILALIEISPDKDRFELYRTYNRLTGAWVQAELSQTLLQQAEAATSSAEEEEIRTTLRDQARFALWELDQARMDLERNIPDAGQTEHLRINVAIRSLFIDAGAIFGRLLADQCAHLQCPDDR
jgi:hypothetical protein